MKKYAVALGLALLVAAPIVAQKSGEKEPAKCGDSKCGKTDPKCGKTEKKDAEDYFKVYKTKGNNWTIKSTSKYGDEETTYYIKTEITEVTKEKAVIKVVTMDKDKKVQEGSEYTYDMDFEAMTPSEPEDEAPEPTDVPKPTIETIKVAAGEFECEKVTYESEGYKSTYWTSTKWHILVKLENISGEKMENKDTQELIEFSAK